MSREKYKKKYASPLREGRPQRKTGAILQRSLNVRLRNSPLIWQQWTFDVLGTHTCINTYKQVFTSTCSRAQTHAPINKLIFKIRLNYQRMCLSRQIFTSQRREIHKNSFMATGYNFRMTMGKASHGGEREPSGSHIGRLGFQGDLG